MNALLLAAHLLTAQAPLQPSTPPPPPASADAPAWYGWQTLAADGLALGFLGGAWAVAGSREAGGSATDIAGRLIFAGVGTYLIGGAAVHWWHDRRWIALADIGLRVGIPFAAGVVGLGLDVLTGSIYRGAYLSSVGFFLLGPLAAIIFDAAYLARDLSAESPSGPARVQWTPFIGASNGSAVAGLAGVF